MRRKINRLTARIRYKRLEQNHLVDFRKKYIDTKNELADVKVKYTKTHNQMIHYKSKYESAHQNMLLYKSFLEQSEQEKEQYRAMFLKAKREKERYKSEYSAAKERFQRENAKLENRIGDLEGKLERTRRKQNTVSRGQSGSDFRNTPHHHSGISGTSRSRALGQLNSINTMRSWGGF